MSRKRPQQSETDVLKALYPDLMTSDDYETKTEVKDDGQKELQTLREQVAKLEGRLSATSQPTPQRQQSQRQAPQRPDYNTIVAAAPDPVADPQAYAKYITELTALQVNYEKAAYAYEQDTAREANGRVQSLWTNFSAKHSDYAKDEEKVSIAATSVVQKARAAGVDLDQYMYAQQDKFFSDVVAESDRLFGKQKAKDDSTDDDVDLTDDDEEDNRAQVPAGGASASRDGPSKTSARPTQFGSLGTMLNDWQSKTGFYR